MTHYQLDQVEDFFNDTWIVFYRGELGYDCLTSGSTFLGRMPCTLNEVTVGIALIDCENRPSGSTWAEITSSSGTVLTNVVFDIDIDQVERVLERVHGKQTNQ